MCVSTTISQTRIRYSHVSAMTRRLDFPGGSPGFAEPSTFASNQNISNHGRNVAISETHIFSDHNINQFTRGTTGFSTSSSRKATDHARRPTSVRVFLEQTLTASVLSAPGSYAVHDILCQLWPLGGVAEWRILGLGRSRFRALQGGTNVFSISDSFDMIRGKHDIRVGAGFSANQMNVMTNAFQDGSFSVTGTV